MLTEEEKVMKGAQLKAGRGKQTWLEKQPEPGVGLGGSDQMLFGPPPPSLARIFVAAERICSGWISSRGSRPGPDGGSTLLHHHTLGSG